MTKQNNARPVSFALITLGFFFFFNPQFAAVDILPDFIGCIFIVLGLVRVARINTQLADTRAAFIRLLAVFLVKDLATLVVFGMTTPAERPVALLLVSFAGAVLGYYFAFGAFHALFEGLYALSVLRECPALYGKHRQPRFFAWRGRELSRPELALRYTLVFLALRETLGVLPEFAALTTSSYIDSGVDRIYEYIGVMRFLASSLALILGIVWFVLICRFFAAVRRERDFRTTLGAQEAAWRDLHPGDALTRRFRLSFLLLSIGAFFLADFRLDLHNVLPDAVAAALFVAGILVAKLSTREKLLLCTLSAAFGVSATASEHFALYFGSNFHASAISKAEDAAQAYFAMWGSAFIEFLLFLAMLACLLLVLRRIVARHAGYVPIHDELEFAKRSRAAYLQEFDRDLLRVFSIGFIAALTSFLYDYIQEIPNKRIFRLLEFLWGIDLCLNVAFAVMLAALLATIHREIHGRFALEG
jgi:hypothetical protein